MATVGRLDVPGSHLWHFERTEADEGTELDEDIVTVAAGGASKLPDLVIDDPTITVQNIVLSADLRAQLNLNAIAIGFGLEAVEYEPEQFPGLVYRLDTPDVVTLLFGSGKVVITGAKTPDAAEEALKKVSGELSELGLVDS